MEKRKFKDPLRDVETKFRSGKELDQWSRFHRAHDAYKRKLNHLIIIYNSYVERYPSFKKNMEINKKMSEALKKGKHAKWSKKESEDIKKNSKDLELIEIDYEDFFLHARILMDYIARLSLFFFEPDFTFSKKYYHSKLLRYTSFNKHKNWLGNPDPAYPHDQIPKEYKDYIINNTDWFEELKNFRDKTIKTIVHPLYFKSRGMISYKTGETLPVWFGEKDKKPPIIKLPDIEKIMNNILDFLNFLKVFYTFCVTGIKYKTIFSYEDPKAGKILYR